MRKGSTIRRAMLLAATSGVALLTAVEVQAQAQPTPPEHYTLDPRGVDLVKGTFTTVANDVVIGIPGQGGIVHARVFTNGGWRDTLAGTVSVSGSTYTVSLGAVSEIFIKSGTTFTPISNRGASLVQTNPALLTLTLSDGTVAEYTTTYSGSTIAYSANNAALISVRQPNGERLTYHWNGVTYCDARGPSEDPNEPGPCLIWRNAVRLDAVNNNQGYQINFQYASNTVPENGRDARRNWLRRTGARGINLAVDYCSPNGGGCTGTQTWPSISYTSETSEDYGGTITSTTDQSGRTTTYAYSGQLTGIRYPGSTSDDVSIAYTAGKVSQVTDATGTWTYGYVDSGTTRTTTSNGPLGQQLVAVSDQTIGRATSVKDALNRTTSYQYDTQRRLQRVTLPEGEYSQLTYDARGNVTQTLSVPRTGSTLPNITTSATYPATCANPVTCNQPTSTTDARGHVTDYTYDSSHGGLLSVTSPAPTTGAALPQTRISYAPQTAWFKNSAGTLVASPTSVTLPITISACTTGASCIGTANEVKTSIVYGASGVANNLLPTSTTTGAGNNSLNATTVMAYTPNGDVASVDGPLPGNADTTHYRYDAARQLVGVIAADPDGANPLPRQAQRTTYNPNGTVQKVESGTVTGTTDAAWTAFSSLQQQTLTYDALARPIRTTVTAGGTTHAVQQVSYDAAGRVDCTATRMNPASFAALPASACTASPTAGFGPDRITRNTYDVASQLIGVTNGFGSTAPITEGASYTANGQVQTLTDGKGNVSTLEYDGFGRLSKLRYPNASGAGSSTTDYEQYGYDAASNVISTRSRAGQTFTATYDNLNRQTALNAPAGTPSTTYAYDNLGRMVSAAIPGQALSFTWDVLGRKLTETSSLGTMAYQYDAAGRRTRMTWPDNVFVTYEYNTVDAMTAIKLSGTTSIIAYGYDAEGRRASATRGNGVTTAYGYDGVGRMTSLAHNLAGTAQDVTWNYSYNPAGQITTSTRSNPLYAFPAATAATTDAYTINGLNQTTAVNGTAVTHSANGNITNALGKAFTYDGANRLTSSGSSTLSYDAVGRLREMLGTSGARYIYDGNEVGALINTGNSAINNRFVRGPWPDEVIVSYQGGGTTTPLWSLQDHQTSIVAITDATGAAPYINSYDEYGRPAPGNTGRFQYTGQLWLPDFGVYHYKARAYHPGLGRFMQTDPIGYAAGANLYAYVGNDPVNRNDPLGLAQFRVLLYQDCLQTSFSMNGVVYATSISDCRNVYGDLSVNLGAENSNNGNALGETGGRGTRAGIQESQRRACSDPVFSRYIGNPEFENRAREAMSRAQSTPNFGLAGEIRENGSEHGFFAGRYGSKVVFGTIFTNYRELRLSPSFFYRPIFSSNQVLFHTHQSPNPKATGNLSNPDINWSNRSRTPIIAQNEDGMRYCHVPN